MRVCGQLKVQTLSPQANLSRTSHQARLKSPSKHISLKTEKTWQRDLLPEFYSVQVKAKRNDKY